MKINDEKKGIKFFEIMSLKAILTKESSDCSKKIEMSNYEKCLYEIITISKFKN